MIEFKPISLEDKSLYESYLMDGKERGCEYSFSNLYLWGQQNATILHGHMVLMSRFNNITVYPHPVGTGDVKEAMDAIMADAKERNLPLIITGMCRESQKNLEELYPGEFVFQGSQDYDDYVYAIDDLADLKGRKYHRKKNHYNRFLKNYPSYQALPLTVEYLPKVKQMLDEWYDAKRIQNPGTDFSMERLALYKAFEHYEELGMEGMVLTFEEEVLAFTMASRMSRDTFDVHFEKAKEDVDGAYTAINCEFARYIREKYPEIQFLNREEDMGQEGLRKAKESYYPHHMVEKCRARWKGSVDQSGKGTEKELEKEFDQELEKEFLQEAVKVDESTEAQITQLRKLWKEAFGDSEEFLDIFYRTGFHPSRCRCVTMGGKVVAALYWFDCSRNNALPTKRIAYIYAVATLEEYRGQGLCHKLMQDTLNHLREAGYEGAILVPAGEELSRFYHHMGYEPCTFVNEFECIGQEMNISVRTIEKEEYATLRRKFLPEGGMIQEHENMDFLETMANFYTGEDFLLAAYDEEGTLRGIELLGDAHKAPGILHALGYKEGQFRSPGDQTSFAMYFSFTEKAEIPSYFGLAFD